MSDTTIVIRRPTATRIQAASGSAQSCTPQKLKANIQVAVELVQKAKIQMIKHCRLKPYLIKTPKSLAQLYYEEGALREITNYLESTSTESRSPKFLKKIKNKIAEHIASLTSITKNMCNNSELAVSTNLLKTATEILLKEWRQL